MREDREHREGVWSQAGRLLGAPEFVLPWMDRFLEITEAEFLIALGGRRSAEDSEELAASLLVVDSLPDIAGRARAAAALERLHRRGLVDLLDDEGLPVEPGGRAALVAVAGFHARFEIWALFEGWKDVPDEVRARLNQWELDAYEQRKLPQIAALKRGERPDPGLENAEYLLLHEAEAVIDRVERVFVWPCNCRAMMGRCDKPLNTCLRFENNRGVGWEISKERAKQVLREASRAGLMHTGELAREGERITGAICNCCGDCCYPHLIAERLQAAKLWPHSRYVARHLLEKCTACGSCVRRCPFGAFAWPEGAGDSARARRQSGVKPRLDPEVCRGCGVCWVACPEKAIAMDALEHAAAGLEAPPDGC